MRTTYEGRQFAAAGFQLKQYRKAVARYEETAENFSSIGLFATLVARVIWGDTP